MTGETRFIDFRGTPQAVADIVTVAGDLPSVEAVRSTSQTGGELEIKAGYTYEEVSSAIHTALRERWPERYGD